MAPTDSSRPAPRTAFVLAGGGFKGAFELGALNHIVGELGITPDIITSASAGSILGMVLGQARAADECVARLADARGDLLAMTETDVVFGEQPWLAELQGTTAADTIRSLITERTTPDLPGGDPDPDPTTTAGAGPPRWQVIRDRWTELAQVAERLPAAHRARKADAGPGRAVLNLDPFEAAIRGHAPSGITEVHPELVARPGLDLRMAVTALKARETHYVCGDGTLVGPDAHTPVPGVAGFDLIDGAIASASVPGVFPPRRLGADTYVDGGCLQNIPLAAAASLGPDRIFTVIAVPVRQTPRSMSLWAAEELGFLSTQAENLASPIPDGCTNTLVEPTLEVVGSFEVHPGLMAIDSGYGRMRAEEALADLDDGTSRIVTTASDTVTLERDRAWHLEDVCLSDGTMSDERRRALSDLKAAVRGAVAARTALGFAEPPGAEQWWTGWELHAREIPEDFPTDFS